MELYTLLREMADSWGMLFLFGSFLVVVLLMFRPGVSKLHKDASMIPLRDDNIDREPEQPAATEQEASK